MIMNWRNIFLKLLLGIGKILQYKEWISLASLSTSELLGAPQIKVEG